MAEQRHRIHHRPDEPGVGDRMPRLHQSHGRGSPNARKDHPLGHLLHRCHQILYSLAVRHWHGVQYPISRECHFTPTGVPIFEIFHQATNVTGACALETLVILTVNWLSHRVPYVEEPPVLELCERRWSGNVDSDNSKTVSDYALHHITGT
jgi:hypothetical protein